MVLTVVVLNYHHRTAETHEMPHWVRDMAPSYHSSDWGGKRSCFPVSGPRPVPAVAAVAAAHEPPGEAHHPQDNPDDQQDEGAGDEGEVVQEPPRQRARHGRRLQVMTQVEVGNVSKLHTVRVHIAVHTFYTKQFSLPGLSVSGRGREHCRRRGALVWESTPHPPTVIKFPLGCVGAKSAGGEADWRNGIGIFLLPLPLVADPICTRGRKGGGERKRKEARHLLPIRRRFPSRKHLFSKRSLLLLSPPLHSAGGGCQARVYPRA